jgi:hypothetical protein
VKRNSKIAVLILLFCFPSIYSFSQELFASGKLNDIEYVFTGKENYQDKKSLTHALAYSYFKDIGDIEAKIKYHTHYQTIKKENQGFETIIRLGPEIVSGHTELLGFDIKSQVLPKLQSLSLFIYKGDELVYVKNVADLESRGKSLFFTFRHQRFGKDWKLELKRPIWEFQYDESYFDKAWEQIANYQIASGWLEEVKKYKTDYKTEEYILKTRLVQLLKAMKAMEFYAFTSENLQQDPAQFQKELEICLFKFEKDIALVKPQLEQAPLSQFIDHYFSFEVFLLNLQQHHSRLYGNIYDEIYPHQIEYFSLNLIDEFVDKNQRKEFELLYQKKALDFIDQLIKEQKTPQALDQISSFETFYLHSQFLSESGSFKRFKARAVYDIYLSYIQVSKQALEHDRIDMAIQYLDKASHIQKEYSAEIINNILVEKEMRHMIKRAMSRYQILLDEGKTDHAKKMKEGIQGLMKKLGIETNHYPIG